MDPNAPDAMGPEMMEPDAIASAAEAPGILNPSPRTPQTPAQIRREIRAKQQILEDIRTRHRESERAIRHELATLQRRYNQSIEEMVDEMEENVDSPTAAPTD